MISHKHKCVFIHVPKCGGQSVEHIFLKESGLTWETRAPLLLRPNDDERLGPPRLAHLTYQDYIRYGYASEELMKDYTTFAVVRNPYKRVESLYRFWGYDAAIPFEQFVNHVLADQLSKKGDRYWFFRPQSDFVIDSDGSVAVDHLIKLEEISHSLPEVLSQLGLRVKSIPHVNKSNGQKNFLQSFKARIHFALHGVYTLSLKVDGRVFWRESDKEKVQDMYANDFRLLGYEEMPLKKRVL